jgi:pyridoxine 5-phosphate synthase
MTHLSVNVNKIATLRNSRGKNTPDVVRSSLDLIAFGAEGITVHPRPDERHIRRQDVLDLAQAVTVEFNIEGYPSEDYLELVEKVRPAQATLVPDPPEALTSNAGWDIVKNREFLQLVLSRLKRAQVRTSLFIDPFTLNDHALETLKEIHPDRIELYTEAYADAYPTSRRDEVTAVYKKAADNAIRLGIGINAGHDLNLHNLKHLALSIPQLDEVSIGHALISDSLYFGFEKTIEKYLACLKI